MNRQLVPWLMLGVAGLMCGCATTGYQRASQAVAAVNQARSVTMNVQRELESAMAVMGTLTGPGAVNLRSLYENYSVAVRNLVGEAKRLEPGRRAVIERENDYLATWRNELDRYQEQELRTRSAQRRTEVIENLRGVNTEFHETELALRPVLVSLQDLQRYLATDLTASGVASVRSRADRLASEAGDVQRRLQSLLGGLARVAAELSPVNLPPAQPMPAPAK